ncbi:uncharacterized protein A1O5_08894 [Cladophialophora psammophila CBS 110553]|uniref:Clr5 domain-containing protein n=1 Tax=Cladophialophora psammophila CBS 110553 TaxID=1182543 RepID=W9XCW6_9EURO|nr:uncharacterized protein A1O5_08894 [Cladophialophora psammophila CBS 110553]EXJ68279.1 hypothetical protein A1O5_08894 [Cladophialophora psammophila CBS 110553]
MAAVEETSSSPSLESLLSLWPIASTLSQHLPVGDLITLARLNVALRSLLHGFEPLEEDTSVPPEDSRFVRTGLNVGHHATPYWQRLKNQSPFECSSRIHTKGPQPKPCRYCSRPICDACIVRSSFARGHENTFQNRVRYLCKNCWDSGNPSRTQRFPLAGPSESTSKRKWYDPDGSTRDYCACTLKDDGWLCLECKDSQNWDAISCADRECHGQDCKESLDADDKDRRRICLWCNKGLPRQIGGTTRYYWNQKMIEARARNAASRQADLEEYNRRRLKLMRMSRREMRGDESVKGDPDADLPQFVRHLDTINYRSYMSESEAPSGDAVYGSKRGYWRYTREFLLRMRGRCGQVSPPKPLNVPENNIEGGRLRFARTNAEKAEDFSSLVQALPRIPDKRLAKWCTFKAVILEYLLVDRLSYQAAQQNMHDDYGFNASIEEYHKVMRIWNTQDAIRKHRRKSLDQEVAEAIKSKNYSLAKQPRKVIDREAVWLDGDGGDLGSQSSSESSDIDPGDYEFTSWRRSSANQEQHTNQDDEGESALRREMKQDRESSSAQALAQPSSSQPLSSSESAPEPSNSDDGGGGVDDNTTVSALLPRSAEAASADETPLDPSFDGVVDSLPHREQDNEDNPPPYTANGWVWPGEEGQNLY